MRILATVLLCVVLVPANAEAKKHKAQRDSESSSATIKLLLEMKRDIATLNLRLERAGLSAVPLPRNRVVASADPTLPMPRRNPLAVAPMPIPDASKTLKGYERQIARSAKLKDLTPKLADKVAEILANCPGTRLSSGYRPGALINGKRGHPSLHGTYPAKAADLAGNPRCILKHLAGWPGGRSIDYYTAPGGKHYHISYAPGSREWGAKFAHSQPRHARHHRRYASVQ